MTTLEPVHRPVDADLIASLSRRGVLTGGLAAVLLGGAAIALPSPAWAADAPQNPAQMAKLALSLVGTGAEPKHPNLRGLQRDYITDDKWNSYWGAWCAVFATWLTRGAGVAYKTWADDAYAQGTPVSTPAQGDFISYPGRHVGVVVGTANGRVQTVEGNVPGDRYSWDKTWVRKYDPPWDTNVRFSRPDWPSNAPATDDPPAPPPIIEDDMKSTQTARPTFGLLLAPPRGGSSPNPA